MTMNRLSPYMSLDRITHMRKDMQTRHDNNCSNQFIFLEHVLRGLNCTFNFLEEQSIEELKQ
jgi:hypothetical protein